jgi:hypothetical protein
MAAIRWTQETQGIGILFPVDGVEAVQDFEEYTFHAPRPGFFLGDSLAPCGHENPVSRYERKNRSDNIKSSPSFPPFLGNLDHLPSELLCQVFTYLDICSLLTFRRVNQYAMEVVNSFPSFRSIYNFPKLLGAVEALQCRSWTAEAMMHCVLDERCRCGHFGDLLYLVTPERWCYKCWLDCSDLGVQRFKPPMMAGEEGLSLRQHVPNVRLSVGYYGLNAKAAVSEPIVAFDMRALRCALPAACDWYGHDVRRGHPLRYTTVIRAPYWDAHSARFEEGFHCRACASQGWLHRSRAGISIFFREDYPIWGLPWRRYTRDGMRAHIERYGMIHRVQDHSGEVRYVHEKPFAKFVWDEPDELREMAHLLHRCRDKELVFLQGQPFLPSWEGVYVDYDRKEGL